MARATANPVLPLQDQRLITALQYDARLTARRAAEVLGVSHSTVRRRWQALSGDGTFRVVISPLAQPRGNGLTGGLFLRIRVQRDKLDTIVAALAARDDVPFIDVTTSGDEILAIAGTEPGSRDPLVFRQLPSTQAVTSVETATVLHVFRLTSEWRHQVLTPAERAALVPRTPPPGPPAGGPYGIEVDPVDRSIVQALTPDARLPAATVAARTGHPEATVRRRIARLIADGRLVTQVLVDPRRLGLAIDANLMLRVPPDHLASAGKILAEHPSVHGAFATSGPFNLSAHVWLPDAEALYEMLSGDLAGLGITHVETVITSHAAKRPWLPGVRADRSTAR